MSIDQHIRDLAEQGTVAALEEHLPSILASFTLPADPDERLTIAEAAEFLRMPEKTVRERIKDERLLAFRDGTRLYVLRRDLIAYNDALRNRAQFERDQSAKASAPAGVSQEVLDLLRPASPGRSAKKKARSS